jgi:hypothetical protein
MFLVGDEVDNFGVTMAQALLSGVAFAGRVVKKVGTSVPRLRVLAQRP